MNKKDAEKLAKALATTCVRNGFIEELHSGLTAESSTGDYSDVKVVTPKQDIPWNELSRLDNDEMKYLMKEVVNRLYTVFLNMENDEFMSALFKLGNEYAANWDRPEELNDFIVSQKKGEKSLLKE